MCACAVGPWALVGRGVGRRGAGVRLRGVGTRGRGPSEPRVCVFRASRQSVDAPGGAPVCLKPCHGHHAVFPSHARKGLGDLQAGLRLGARPAMAGSHAFRGEFETGVGKVAPALGLCKASVLLPWSAKGGRAQSSRAACLRRPCCAAGGGGGQCRRQLGLDLRQCWVFFLCSWLCAIFPCL